MLRAGAVAARSRHGAARGCAAVRAAAPHHCTLSAPLTRHRAGASHYGRAFGPRTLPSQTTRNFGGSRRLSGKHTTPPPGSYWSEGGEIAEDDLQFAPGSESEDDAQRFIWERDVVKIATSDQLHAFYEVGTVIGYGTYGVVRKCRCKNTGATVAIKTVKKSGSAHYKREVVLSSRVHHPSVLSPLRVFESADEVFIVTEFCQGGELFEFVADHNLYLGTLSETSILEVTREMLVALETCHKAGFAHLDVKPENFVFRIPWSECLTDIHKIRNNLVLIDFGAAQPFRLRKYAERSDQYVSNMDEHFRGESSLGGTASYVSPEVLQQRFSSRSDIWSLGVTLFMLIAGRRPFDASFEHAPSVFDRKVQENIRMEASRPLGQSLYSTCEELGLAHTSTVDLLLNMMHPDPKERKSATELIAEIDRMLEEDH